MDRTVTFYGRDYSPIEQDLNLVEPLGFDWELSFAEKRKLLLIFLNAVMAKSSGLVINNKGGSSLELFSNLGDDKYYFGGVVGVVSSKLHLFKSDIKESLGESEENTDFEVAVTLQIQSRFDVDSNKGISKPFFLSTMLSESDPNLNNDFVPSNTSDYLFDFLLLFAFKARLREAYLKGFYRTYHRFENNDDHLKGSIDIAKHIKMNMGLNNGKIAYSFRDNSIDNYLNHLIVASYSYLKKKYFSLVNSAFDNVAELKSIIEHLKEGIQFPKYDLKTIIFKNLNSISHPFYTEYEALRKICLRILRNEGASVFDGESSEEVEGILFYIPDLWEKYLESFLISSNYYICMQKRIDVIDYGSDWEFRQTTYPDYVFYLDKQGMHPFMVLDAKFKEKWSDLVFAMGSFSSVLDDYDKCIRDMNSIGGHATGVIFPTNNIKAKEPYQYISHHISEYNKTDLFYTFPIYVPYSEGDYRDWIKAFRNNCKESTKMVEKCVLAEKTFATNCLNEVNYPSR